MARHKVDSASMAELLTELNKMIEFSAELIADIDKAKDAVSAEWTGNANAQFQALHAEWSDGAGKMSDGVQKIKTAATTASDNYDGVADHVKGLWG